MPHFVLLLLISYFEGLMLTSFEFVSFFAQYVLLGVVWKPSGDDHKSLLLLPLGKPQNSFATILNDTYSIPYFGDFILIWSFFTSEIWRLHSCEMAHLRGRISWAALMNVFPGLISAHPFMKRKYLYDWWHSPSAAPGITSTLLLYEPGEFSPANNNM